MKFFYGLLVTIALVFTANISHASQLSTDARTAIPKDIQQLVVIDYRAMQESPAAMALRNRVMLPELKQLEEALQNWDSTTIMTLSSLHLRFSATAKRAKRRRLWVWRRVSSR